jgi:hypothetical protein
MRAFPPGGGSAIELLQASHLIRDDRLAHGKPRDASILYGRSLLDGEDRGPPVIGEQLPKACGGVKATITSPVEPFPHPPGRCYQASAPAAGACQGDWRRMR